MSAVAGFALGLLAAWALATVARSMAFGGRRIGSGARQRWLAKLDYESLLRTHNQIMEEIRRRQPTVPEADTEVRPYDQ